MMTTAGEEKVTLPHYMDVRIVAVIKQAVLAEREACAKIADSFTSRNPENTMTQDSLSEVAEDIAEAIRARNASQG